MSVFNKLISLTKATIEQVKAGLPATTEEEIKQRALACDECDSLDRENYKCGECGCYLKYKIAWATQKCPLGKWGDDKIN